MTTTLRMFYARALFLLAVLFLIAVAFAGVAFAQDAAAPAVEDYTGLAGLANSALTGIATALAALVVAVVARLWNMIPEGLRAVIEHIRANTSLKDTTDTAAWHKSLQDLSHDGVIYAATKLGMDPKSIESWEEKNAFLKMAGAFVGKFDSDIKLLIDKDGDGVPDVVQVALARIAPQTVAIAPPAQAAPQTLMSAPEPRRVKQRVADEALERFATKFAPVKRPRGTVTQ